MSENKETITLDQLEEGLKSLGYIAGENSNFPGSRGTFRIVNTRAVAEVIFRRFREPEYEPGAVYVSRHGTFYYRTNNGKWRDCSTGIVISHEHPSRPLTKLVPEDG